MLHGFEQFNPGDGNVGSFGGIPNFSGGGMPRPGDGNVANFMNPMQGLDLGNLDPMKTKDEGGFNLMRMLFGGTDGATGDKQMGALTGGLGALSGIANSVIGYKQYGLAKKELAFQEKQAGINNQNQMTTLNNLMRGQADNRRIATGGGPTGEEYVAQNGIKV